MVHVKNFSADCIKDLEIRGVTVCHNWKRYNARVCVYGGKKEYWVEDELANYNDKWITLTEDEFGEHFCRVPNKLKIEFAAHFETDGDYTVERSEEMETLSHIKHIYARNDDGVNMEYMADWDSDYETIDFHLVVEGNPDNCRNIARMLLEEMMCSIRTSRHHILIALINKLNDFYEHLTQVKDRNLELYDYMSGNYDGTEMALTVMEICDKNEA